jgi:hypothetical protein
MPAAADGPVLRAGRRADARQLRRLLKPPAPRRPPGDRQQRAARAPAGPERVRGFLSEPGGDIGLIAATRGPPGGAAARWRRSTRGWSRSNAARRSRPKVAFCSGSGNGAVGALAATGVDTLVTGELREEHFNRAQEDWAQPLPLRALRHRGARGEGPGGRARAAKFGLPWDFIATDNPL